MKDPDSGQPILVIEDDLSIRELVIGTLEEDGYDVISARDGEHGLSVARDRSPGLIVLDLRMPNLGGVDFLERYHRTPPPHAPVLVVTAASTEIQMSVEPMVDAVIAKPFDIDEFLSLVGRLVQRSPS
jgi:DNA-binding response OmpR family regulator